MDTRMPKPTNTVGELEQNQNLYNQIKVYSGEIIGSNDQLHDLSEILQFQYNRGFNDGICNGIVSGRSEGFVWGFGCGLTCMLVILGVVYLCTERKTYG